MPTQPSQATAEGMPRPQERTSLHKINHLAKEMSAALDNIDGYHVVIVHPSASANYPVHICLDKEFADLLQSVIELRKGTENAKPCR